MSYHHLNDEERSQIAWMKASGCSRREIATRLGRAASTISRELRRNRYPTDGSYKALHAGSMARGRRRRARQGTRFKPLQWMEVEALLRQDYSPEQASGRLKLTGSLSISHETIYRRVWADKSLGGTLHLHLRGARKQRRKGYGNYDSRGRLAGKRDITERPEAAERRSEIGHWEVDTVHGRGKGSIATLVDRKTGYLLIGKLGSRTAEETNWRLRRLIGRHPGAFATITADNGCEFHGYATLEGQTGVEFYFAKPYHSWERGTNENTNGLIRQYLPKGCCMDDLTQARCNAIAEKLNHRPRKRHGYRTPAELFNNSIDVALHS
ncbi:MAG: IS30 family transposase [Verrucomicrobiae bacterium]|nr:IS30 family transposase [Verrucomicrobiae bacterium]